MITTQAWVLHEGPLDRPEPGALRLEPFAFDPLVGDEVLVEPLFGCWETNMSHAVARRPIDVCRQRGEAKVVLGNAGVVRVLRPGPRAVGLAPGDVCMLFGSDQVDAHGYTLHAHAYDAPGTVGLLARQTKVTTRALVRIPPETRYSLAQWAAFSVRYITAWSNWDVAYRTYRIQMTERDMPSPHVWGWGGGTTLAELDLARRHGCSAAMISSRPKRLETITALGLMAVDRRQFPNLSYDEDAQRRDPALRRAYRESEQAFVDYVLEHTGGEGVSIFLDYIGTPVMRATLRALARQGVIATAGWRSGMSVSYNRAVASIRRQTLVHTHYMRNTDAPVAMEYAERTGWMPPETSAVYAWDDVPRLAAEFAADQIDSYFPIFAVNPV